MFDLDPVKPKVQEILDVNRTFAFNSEQKKVYLVEKVLMEGDQDPNDSVSSAN